ncbi:hypothetical protein TanjilG_18974 [Lupinus angustifolius]|uniref:Late embryogenesis abundant protein LEA-2 subgroup domain-containing protein n=1 Tax=Lupinus angustifolius TaxID=3871 RepID=A0A4P1RRH3_LUPAN|nr:PREDICTED: NDR1/HIN1-Like protein 3-like [Lupinus angustifolius]OIW16259.1 hypothetical protein TanjilG_18974 [Lupinus angustifolius]
MAERVHPFNSSPSSPEHETTPSHKLALVAASPTPPGTYVIKIPKEQVYRIPPPENAVKYNQHAIRNKPRCRFCCWFIGILFTLIILLVIAAAVFYLVFRPTAIVYSIESIAIAGLNLTSPSSAASLSPKLNVTVIANNPNRKIGIRYMKDSSAEIFFNDVELCNGVLPAFYQPSNNVTVFKVALKGHAIKLKDSDRTSLEEEQNKQKVPFTVKLKIPVKIKVGVIETWKINIKVKCDVTVDKLTTEAKVESKHCNYRVNIFGK